MATQNTVPQSTAHSYQGVWSPSSRSHKSLLFLEKYTTMVKACNFLDPYHTWYSASAVFYNGDGNTYRGGDQIWSWMHHLFAPFDHLEEPDESRTVTIVKHAVVPDDTGRLSEGRLADLVLYEHTLVFYLKGEQLKGKGIPVRRMMEFVIAESEIQGQGTDGLQIWRGKVWWDTMVLARETEKLKRLIEST